ncbi:MAG: hypothetical protein U5J62_03890 [Desulfurivibrio sp.]|nr:hypothetical protein [Desulfurivibrio sp.]
MAMVVFLVYLGCWSLLHTTHPLKTGLVLLSMTVTVIGVLAAVYGLDHYYDLLLLRGTSYRLEIWKGYIMYPPDSLLLGFGAGTAPEQLEAAREYRVPRD